MAVKFNGRVAGGSALPSSIDRKNRSTCRFLSGEIVFHWYGGVAFGYTPPSLFGCRPGSSSRGPIRFACFICASLRERGVLSRGVCETGDGMRGKHVGQPHQCFDENTERVALQRRLPEELAREKGDGSRW